MEQNKIDIFVKEEKEKSNIREYMRQLLVFSTSNLYAALNPVSYIELKMSQSKLLVLLLLLALIYGAHTQCCTSFEDGICVACPNGMHLYRDNCIFDLPNCQDYQNGFDCSKCAEGYEIAGNGKCSEIPVQIAEATEIVVQDPQVTGVILEATNEVVQPTGIEIEASQTSGQVIDATSQGAESSGIAFENSQVTLETVETVETVETAQTTTQDLPNSETSGTGANQVVVSAENLQPANLREAEQTAGNRTLILPPQDNGNRTAQEIEAEKSLISGSLRTRNAGLKPIQLSQLQSDEKFTTIDSAVRQIPYIRSTILILYFDYGLQSISLYSCYYWDPSIDTTYQILVVWDPISLTPQLEGVAEIQA